MTVDIVIYLCRDWKSDSPNDKGYFTECQFIRALAKMPRIKILCINRPVTPIETSLKKPSKVKNYFKEGNLLNVDNNLFVYTPLAFLHDQVAPYVLFMERMNRKILAFQIRKYLRRLGFFSPLRVSWIYHPLQYNYLGLAGERFTVYDCFDEYVLRAGPGFQKRRIAFHEKEILASSDLVITPSSVLYRGKLKASKNLHFVPGAVEIDRFLEFLNKDVSIPDDLACIKPPRIGFTGVINEKVDLELINFLAEKYPQWAFVMIGNIRIHGPAYRYSRSLPNVHYLGYKDYEKMPLYNKFFDVCLLPYRNIEIMNYTHPHKTYQHLASGKPVVSTDMPDIRPLSRVVKIADTYEAFGKMIEESLCDTGKEAVEKRINVAKQNTWQKRARQVHELINQVSSTNRTLNTDDSLYIFQTNK